MEHKHKTAVLLALGTAVISGFAIFLSKISVTVIKNATVFTTLKNALVALALVSIVLLTSKRKELRGLTRRDWTRLVLIGIVGGSVPFLLFFNGLQQTSAVNAAFLQKTLFVWVALLAIPFLKERIAPLQGFALGLLLAANLVLSGLHTFKLGKGEWMILASALLWAVEYVIAKKALANISSTVVAASRMGFGAVILIAVVAFQGKLGLVATLSGTQWLWTLIPSAVLLGYVTFWYAALKRAPAIVVSALLVPAPFITSLLAFIVQKKAFSVNDMVASVLFALAVALILRYGRFASPNTTDEPALRGV